MKWGDIGPGDVFEDFDFPEGDNLYLVLSVGPSGFAPYERVYRCVELTTLGEATYHADAAQPAANVVVHKRPEGG